MSNVNYALKPENELVLFDGCYMDLKTYNHIKNHAKMEMINSQRREMREVQKMRDFYTEEKSIIRSVFVRQKKLGIMITLLSILLLIVSCEGFCFAGIAIGLYAIFTKKIIINDYNLAAWEEMKNEKF